MHVGNRMKVIEMKIFSKLHEPLGECKLKEFSDITLSSVNPYLLEQSYDNSFFNMIEKIANASALICAATFVILFLNHAGGDGDRHRARDATTYIAKFRKDIEFNKN